jgi:septin family protein
MAQRLFVAVLGNRNSGKSTTWNTLFDRTVKTGKQSRSLELRPGECVNVFLVSGSFEERSLYAGDVLDDQDSNIVLCSIQYTEEVAKTLDYVKEKGFDLCVHWLNPGFSDAEMNLDRLGLVNQLLDASAVFAIRSGKIDPTARVQELKEFIYGWAAFRGLIFKC